MPFPTDKSVKLNPLSNSYENNEIEKEFKQIFIALFSKIEGNYFDASVMANPQLGSLFLAKKMLAYNGLSVLNSSATEDELKYILKMWLGRNSAKRGLELVRSYLQVLYPNSVEINQLMQDINSPYTQNTFYATDLNKNDIDKYLTSRVEFNLDNANTENIQSYLARVFTDILPARIVPVFKTFGNFDVIAGTIETLAPNIERKIRDINALVINELNPFMLFYEHDTLPAYSLINGLIIYNNVVLDAIDTGRLILDGSWTIKNIGQLPDFTLTVSN